MGLKWEDQKIRKIFTEIEDFSAEAVAETGAKIARGLIKPGPPSSRGQSPASQTGNLKESIGYTAAKNGRAEFGSDAPYAERLEEIGRPYLSKVAEGIAGAYREMQEKAAKAAEKAFKG